MSLVPADIFTLVKSFKALSDSLPSTVGTATRDDKIYTTLVKVNEGDTYMTFNRIFDILFKEDVDCRVNGRLRYLLRGKYGMGKLCAYLNDINWAEPDLPLDLVKIKLDQVIEEMIFLTTLYRKDFATIPKPKPVVKPKPADKSKPVEKAAKTKDRSKAKKKKITPGGPTAMLLKAFNSKDNGESESEDADFRPAKSACRKSEEPAGPYNLDKDGLEIESGIDEQRKRKKVVHTSDEDSDSSDNATKVNKFISAFMWKKTKKRKQKKKAKTAEIRVADVSTEDEDTTRTSTKKGPTNTSRTHFKAPVPVSVNNKRRWEFQCRHCLTSLLFKRTVDREAEFEDEPSQPALGNLATHLKTKHSNIDLKVPPPTTVKGELRGISAASAKIMEGFLKDGALNPALKQSQKGFNSIKRLFKYLETHFMLPTDTTVRNPLARIYTELHETVKTELKEHEGEFAAKAMAKALSDMGVLEKIRITFYFPKTFVLPNIYLKAITIDNAKTNDILIHTLSHLLVQKYDIQFVPGNAHIHCLAHMVNLVIQKILSVLDEADNPDDNDYFEQFMKNLPIHYDPDKDEALKEFEDKDLLLAVDSDDKDSDKDLLAVPAPEDGEEPILVNLSALKKLRAIVTKISFSPQRRAIFQNIVTKSYKDKKVAGTESRVANLMVIRDVRTHWNYTHAMIKHALILQKAINKWVLNCGLQDLSLLLEEWLILEKLGAMLEVFTQVTLQMSHSTTPTLPWVLPMYEHMDRHLQKHIQDPNQLPALRAAAMSGLQKLNHYHSMARECQYNVIATILHPYLGLLWFRKVDPASIRAEKAKILFQHAFARYEAAEPVSEPITRQPAPTSSFSSFIDDVSMADSNVENAPSAPTITFLAEVNPMDLYFGGMYEPY
ncbi:hypothetical protein GALMADRAFT_1362644 [Galerina marginata CBS 339.88]|uniref:Uncharacterized protein n=1 Tax=Galerina marginata (strain CBS 339.88) TaxID=685588 RepID=A0A067SDC0_GALM3|nr:hypothetical protein GALMADRAFT_1362644 [Galerina marginata CBS 339.88]